MHKTFKNIIGFKDYFFNIEYKEVKDFSPMNDGTKDEKIRGLVIFKSFGEQESGCSFFGRPWVF